MEIKDLKIIELASVLAGPAVGMFFAELGARVIKIENKAGGGDVTRSWKTKQEDPESPVSAYFSAVNYGKSYLSMDLKDPEDYAHCMDLVREADVVITNFKRSSAIKLKLDHTHIRQINPKVIVAEITGYKRGNRAAYDVVLQAETGFMSMNGAPDAPPTKLPLAIIDMFAAHQLKQAILIALLKQTSTGKGSYVTVSLEEAALAALSNQASNYLMNGVVASRLGSLHPNIAPYGEILTFNDNRLMVLAIGTDSQFASFCSLLELEDLPNDPLFKHNQARVINRKTLIEKLQHAVSDKKFEGVFTRCGELDIPVGEVKTLNRVLEGDVAQSMILEEEIDGKQTKRIRSCAFNFD